MRRTRDRGIDRCGVGCTLAAMAFKYYASIKGTKQGQIASSSKGGNHRGSNWVPLVALLHGAGKPIDGKGGKLAVVIEHGGVAQKLLNAHLNNEALSEVVIESVDTNASSNERVAQRITLTNASISGYKTYVPHVTPGINAESHPTNPAREYLLEYRVVRISVG